MDTSTFLSILTIVNIAVLVYTSIVLSKVSQQLTSFCQAIDRLGEAIKAQTNLLERIEWRS